MPRVVHSLLPVDIDLLDVAGEDGFIYETGKLGLAGRGEEKRWSINYANGQLGVALGQIRDSLVEYGQDATAFVMVPFTNTRPVVAVLPEVVVKKDIHGVSGISIDRPDIPTEFGSPVKMPAPTHFSVASVRSAKEWCDVVQEAVNRMQSDKLDKVVLAREILVEADVPISRVGVIGELRQSYPTSTIYAVDGVVGACPELLIERQGRTIRSLPYAGTFGRSSDVATDEHFKSTLLSSQKDLSEHKHLTDVIQGVLEPMCESLDIASTPQISTLSNVHHLVTPISGVLRDSSIDVLSLVAALHPTPAVGGRPTAVAMDLIEELEDLDRGYYAGAIGWINAAGDGSFVVSLRCAQIEGTRARVIAGNGMVADSDPQKELQETQWKLQAILSALVRV